MPQDGLNLRLMDEFQRDLPLVPRPYAAMGEALGLTVAEVLARLARLQSLPLVKDLEKTERLRRLWEPWYRRWTAAPDDPRHWETGWLLEEFRVSLFAPDVPCVGKVSEKKIEERVLGEGG